MMKIKLLFLFTLLVSSFNLAQSDIEKGVLRGLDYCYNFKWGKADEEFQKLIDKYPDDLRGYHYKSTISLWYYLSSKSPDDYQNFVRYSDLALHIAAGPLCLPKLKVILMLPGQVKNQNPI